MLVYMTLFALASVVAGQGNGYDRFYTLASDTQSILITLNTFNPNGVSPGCMADLQLFVDGVNNETTWAWLMADAWGYPQSGFFLGDGVWEGAYDECRNVGADPSAAGAITAKLSMTTWPNPTSGLYDGIGTCLPATCNLTDVVTFLITGALTDKLVLPPSFPATDYSGIFAYFAVPPYDKDVTQDGSAIAAITVLSFFGLLVFVGTTFHVVTTLKRKEEAKRMRNAKLQSQNSSKETAAGENGNGISTVRVGLSDAMSQPKTAPTASSANDKDSKSSCCDGTSKLSQLMWAFSAYKYIPGMVSFRHPRGSFECLNGIRFLTFAWIVLGHTFQLGIDFKATQTVSNWSYKVANSRAMLNNMFLAVEAFFVMSAFLTTVSFLKKMSKARRPSVKMMALFYFHRYWRLTPVYMLVLMFYGCLFQYLGGGPFYAPFIPDADNCKKTWWRHLLYINNFDLTDDCMGWTWYLADDFQFYVISPVFLIAYHYKPKLGLVLNILAILGSLVSRFALTTVMYVVQGGYDFGWYYTYVYVMPWSRSATYFLGMLLGYFMFKRDFRKHHIKVPIAILVWLVSLAVMSAMVFVQPSSSDAGQIIFTSLQSPLVGCVVCWIIYACITGNGGVVNSVLSWAGWLPLARLTYVGYLFHPILIYFKYYDNHVQLYMTTWEMVYMFLGHLLLTMGFSFVISFCLELPFGSIENTLLGGARKPPPPPSTAQLAPSSLADTKLEDLSTNL